MHTLAKLLHGFRQQVTWHLQVLIMQKFEAFSPIPFFLGVQDQETYHPPPPNYKAIAAGLSYATVQIIF